MKYPLPPQLNTLTAQGYRKLLASPHGRKQVNTLGLFRSIVENRKLPEEEKAAIRDACREAFPQFYGFLPVKDYRTYWALEALGREMTEADWRALKERSWREAAAWVKQRRIRHRSFGVHSKHECEPTCPMLGTMVKPHFRSMDPSPLSLPYDRRDWWREGDQARQRRNERKAVKRQLRQSLLDPEQP
jgi:hypothetical protein